MPLRFAPHAVHPATIPQSLRELLAFSACALAWVGCDNAEPDIGPTAVAERNRIERIVVATGTIEPEREV